MKIPSDCPFATLPEWPSSDAFDEMHRTGCCRIHARFPTEGPLCRSWRTWNAVYRFTWNSSFHGCAMIHIGRLGKRVVLHWDKYFTDSKANRIVTLSPGDWETLEDSILAANFWSLDQEDKDLFGLDGADWTIEGRREDVYHAVNRWSPRGAIYDLGRLFFALTGPPLASIQLY